MKAPRPILLLEINEVPWRVIDHFRHNFKNIDSFFAKARTHTTETVDEGELSPWITWPTIHRGLPSQEHKVSFLGQDPASFRGVPIWEEYLNAGFDVGVCGSLQSWPPKYPGKKGFFVPDTFAQSPACFPKYVEPFQELNLKMVSENGRVLSHGVPLSSSLFRTALALPRLGIRARTIAKICRQLVLERIDRAYLARRPLFQAELLWDIFRNLYQAQNPPAFATFFTNHVAGIMHRYWQDIFPQDFGREHGDEKYSAAMLQAMGILDGILGDALDFQRKNPEIILVVASSMGQAATEWERFEGVSSLLQKPMALVKALVPEWPRIEDEKIEELLAMVPQTALKIENSSLAKLLAERASACTTLSGEPIFFPVLEDTRLSLSVRTPNATDLAAQGIYIPSGSTKRIATWAEIGMRNESVSPASAYHVPEGILAIRDLKARADDSRGTVKADAVKGILLSLSEAHFPEARV